MNGRTYQSAAQVTEIYTDAANKFIDEIRTAEDGIDAYALGKILKLMYCAGKLNGEAGEIAEYVFKAFRSGDMEGLTDKLYFELGDIMWYVASLCNILGLSLDEVMAANIEKLHDRKDRGVIHGFGDDR